MLHKIIFNKSDIIKIAVKILALLLFCFLTCSVLFCFTATIISRVNFSYEILYPAVAAILAVSAFSDGFIISRWYKENGLIYGVLTGIIISFLLLIVSLKCNLFGLSSQFLTKVSIVIISGAIGGIIGVNTN